MSEILIKVKYCSKCKTERPIEEFSKDMSKKDGLRSVCKLHDKQYRQKNKDKIKEKDKQRYQENKDKIMEQVKRYYQENRDKFNQYCTNRKKSDINFKIRCNLATRICNSIKRKSGIKAQSTINLIGCTVQELRDYLESQFTPEMNWSNFGTYWHIDHIIACAKFNLTDPAEQKKCFNWRNLRPCPAVENLSKSDKLDMGLVKSYNIDDLLPIKGAEN